MDDDKSGKIVSNQFKQKKYFASYNKISCCDKMTSLIIKSVKLPLFPPFLFFFFPLPFFLFDVDLLVSVLEYYY